MLEIACNMNAIPAAEREIHGQRWAQLLQLIAEVTYHDEGYRLTFPTTRLSTC